ncbi:hypothetical protein [Henriciella aquimarina]|uniref:hypothetical protein n=1 Tax=Henriciella aquimarina TaxID=545261 RepID=UPI001179AEBE|nr:hypothetical protein [Henriciella aquimarina]
MRAIQAIFMGLPAGLLAAACASSQPERLEDIQARAMAACPAAVERSQAAGDYAYSLDTCECLAGRITTPLWSDEDSSYSGDPMPVADAKLMERAIREGETLKKGLEQVRADMSIAAENSFNTCFAKF